MILTDRLPGFHRKTQEADFHNAVYSYKRDVELLVGKENESVSPTYKLNPRAVFALPDVPGQRWEGNLQATVLKGTNGGVIQVWSDVGFGLQVEVRGNEAKAYKVDNNGVQGEIVDLVIPERLRNAYTMDKCTAVASAVLQYKQ